MGMGRGFLSGHNTPVNYSPEERKTKEGYWFTSKSPARGDRMLLLQKLCAFEQTELEPPLLQEVICTGGSEKEIKGCVTRDWIEDIPVHDTPLTTSRKYLLVILRKMKPRCGKGCLLHRQYSLGIVPKGPKHDIG